jgi:hypothetical protein
MGEARKANFANAGAKIAEGADPVSLAKDVSP